MPNTLGQTPRIAAVTLLTLTTSQAMAQPNCDALRVALEFIAKQYPNFSAAGKKRVISERGNLWQLTYELPEEMLGGVPTIVVDKRTCAVVSAIHTQ